MGCAYHVKVHPDAPEERQSGRELIDLQPRVVHPKTTIVDPVGNGVGHFQHGVRTGLLHVVARDGDGVEFGHVL